MEANERFVMLIIVANKNLAQLVDLISRWQIKSAIFVQGFQKDDSLDLRIHIFEQFCGNGFVGKSIWYFFVEILSKEFASNALWNPIYKNMMTVVEFPCVLCVVQ